MADTIKAMLREARRHDDYWVQWIVSDFTEELCRRMEALGISRKGLADRIQKSPPYVTKVLRGEQNLTAKSMARLARAVQSVVRVHLAPADTYTVWLDMGDSGAQQSRPAANLEDVVFPGGHTAPVQMSFHGAMNAADVTS
jgi:transcriptional regulator with XRE-family HTH domain